MLDQTSRFPMPDPVPAFLRHLETGNDVIRTGAVRAMIAQAATDDRVRSALLDRLLDEDPDVRTDAMEGLVFCARPEDADIIRRSLQGDPVREVKHAAIRILTHLGDAASIPLLRKLALTRAEDEVAWEDENDAWDDWLDVQVAVIDAMGDMEAQDAIQDLLTARDDEYGQNLDIAVFRALAKMGGEGAVWLLSVAQTEPGLPRKRALEALTSADPAHLRPHLDYILADDSSDVRRLALPLLDADDPRAAVLAGKDPDPQIRSAAVEAFGPDAPNLAISALSDAAESVQATALDVLPETLEPEFRDTLLANAMVWLNKAKPVLATAATRFIARHQHAPALPVLVALTTETDQPLGTRLAAATALARFTDDGSTARLITLMGNEAQQMRAIALTELAVRAGTGDAPASEALIAAMEGTLLASDAAIVLHEEIDAPDAATPKFQKPLRDHIRISEDGEIVEATPQETPSGSSTLAAIQQLASTPEPARAEDTPEESAAKRRKRRPVEGPDEVAEDLQRLALTLAGDIPGAAAEHAVLKVTTHADDPLRQAAFQALRNRAVLGEMSPEAWQCARIGLSDTVPPVRSLSAEILAQNAEFNADLAALLTDEDALVRVIAVGAAAPNQNLVAYLADPARIVREAVLDRILSTDSDALASAAFEALLKAERIHTLGRAITRSPVAHMLAIDRLAMTTLGARQVHVLLEAMATDAIAGGTPSV